MSKPSRRIPRTFIDLCLRGEASVLEIDDFVDRWHDGQDPRELRDFLGMSRNEYAVWVEQASSLRFIIRSHSTGLPLAEVVNLDSRDAVAARSSDPADATSVLAWLRETGRLDDDSA